jgi:hypothetical protein
MINLNLFSRFEDVQPKYAKNFVTVATSDPYPAPVMIGRVKHVENLQPRLWRKLEEEVIRIHDTEEGKQCVRFWRFDSFVKPDQEYTALVKKCARKFPLKALAKAK